jgi:C-terminal processing protease CtpA/Prc
MTRRLVLAAALATFSTLSFAQAGAQAGQEAQTAYAARDYGRAAALYLLAYERDPMHPVALYNAACAYALAGDREAAFRTLQLAMDKGYLNGNAGEVDNDFASLHDDPRWPGLMLRMKERHAFERRLFESPALATPYQANLSEDEKVAGLSKFWSEVKYNFVYVDRLKELDWDRLYLEYLPKVRATTSTAEYYKVLMQLCAKLQDGHTNIYPAAEIRNNWFARPLLAVQQVEGRVFVQHVADPELLARGVKPGMEVVSVDGEPVKAYNERTIGPYLIAATPQDMERRLYGGWFLSGPAALAPNVAFRAHDGKTVEAQVRRVDWDTYGRTIPQPPPFEFRMLPGNVAYVALNGFGDQRAADGYLAAFDQIAKSSALVIDMRNNGGGDSDVGYRVLATLVDHPFETGRSETRDYRPAWRAWQQPLPDYRIPEKPWPSDPEHQYTRPIAVLISKSTFSAGEDFMVAFDSLKRGAIVGEPTGGSTGQPLLVALPGGGSARICTKKDTYPDGRVWVGKGIVPTLRAAPTVADLRRGRDTVLEAALAAVRR